MNLILSDVEETIMIVDLPEGAAEGQGTVNVSNLGDWDQQRLIRTSRSRNEKWTCYLSGEMV